MKKVIKTELSLKSIQELLQKTQKIKSNLEKASNNIVEKLSDYTYQEIQKNISSTPYKDASDDVGAFNVGSKKKRIVGMMGKQAIYDEFGTGTIGENSPHENRKKIKGGKLNWYNTGVTIRENSNPDSKASEAGIPTNGLYWTYNHGGKKIYTQGIPAGKQVFNASISMNKKKKEIIKQEVSDALSKL